MRAYDLLRQIPLASVLVLLVSGGLARAEPKPAGLESRVRGLLKTHCLKCHGATRPKGELSLANRAGLLKGGETGRVIVPGEPEKSLLYEHVRDGEMPPGKGKRLRKADVETFRAWIAQGAPFGPGGRLLRQVTQHEAYAILHLRCVVCHGGRQQNSQLDLRTRGSILKGGKSGPAAVPGQPAQTLLLKKIHDETMPPRRRVVEASIKVIPEGEIEVLTRWIAAGLPLAPDPPHGAPKPALRQGDREFWAFQPPRSATVPQVRNAEAVRDPIDAFLLEKLERQGLSLSAPAGELALLRRASYDVTGLAPTPEEVERFLSDPAPRKWERQVDRLLASPHFGERWARFWLDLAGYSESDGIQNADPIRRAAYRYRDYVIRALNEDKPYDRFVTEQLAGDELADYRNAKVITREIADNLVATGFLRFVPDATYANITGFVPDRLDVINAELEVLTSSLMGITLKCARCHAHKFDPLSQAEYYQLAAVFKGALDEHDWLKPYGTSQFSSGPIGFRHMPIVATAEAEEVKTHNASLVQQVTREKTRLAQRARLLRTKQVDLRLGKLPAPLRADIRKMLVTAKAKRSEVQKYLASKFEKSLTIDDGALKKLEPEFAKASAETEKRIKSFEGQKKEAPFLRALWDRGTPSPTYVLRRGNYLTPGRKVHPDVPAVLSPVGYRFTVQPPWPEAKSTGRRLAFARWLTRDDHPLTARIIVNRIWKHYFGRGIVVTLDNFGKAGARPTHPELLDWLAVDLVRRDWSLKSLHRRILLSAAYRQESAVGDLQQRQDPDNRLFSRMPLKRLEAESLRDSLLAAAGELEMRQFGPSDPVTARADGLVTATRGPRGWRRSIFLLQRRTQIATLLQNFDLPRMNPNCIERPVSNVAPQALHLLNNKMVRELADRFAERVEREVGGGVSAQIERTYHIALSRPPDPEELAASVSALSRLRKQWHAKLEKNDPQADRRALGNFCHALMNSAAFMYID